MKKIEEKKEKAPPEKFFATAISEYFGFHKAHFKDEDGFSLAPNWSEKRGMEMKGLKLLLTTLREIAEAKGAEWTEERMICDFRKFLNRAYNNSLVRKNFLCCMMNRYKLDILSSSYNPHLSKKILDLWYANFPDYTKDDAKDKTASEIIIGFLKQQYLIADIVFSDESVLSSVRIIVSHIKSDEFWSKKSLRSISNNLQEFVTKIKSKKNGNVNNGSIQRTYGNKPIPTIVPKGGFGKL